MTCGTNFLSHNKSLQFQQNQTHCCHRLGACTSSRLFTVTWLHLDRWEPRLLGTSRGSVIRSVSEESGWHFELLVEIPRQFCFVAAAYCYGDHCNHRVSVVSSTQTPGEFTSSSNEMKAVIHSRGFSAAAAQRTWLGDSFVGACLCFFSLRFALFWWVIRHFRLWKRSNIQIWGILPIFRDELTSNVLILLFIPT